MNLNWLFSGRMTIFWLKTKCDAGRWEQLWFEWKLMWWGLRSTKYCNGCRFQWNPLIDEYFVTVNMKPCWGKRKSLWFNAQCFSVSLSCTNDATGTAINNVIQLKFYMNLANLASFNSTDFHTKFIWNRT